MSTTHLVWGDTADPPALGSLMMVEVHYAARDKEELPRGVVCIDHFPVIVFHKTIQQV